MSLIPSIGGALLVVGLVGMTLGGAIIAASSRERWLVALHTACATVSAMALLVVLLVWSA